METMDKVEYSEGGGMNGGRFTKWNKWGRGWKFDRDFRGKGKYFGQKRPPPQIHLAKKQGRNSVAEEKNNFQKSEFLSFNYNF